MRIIAVALCLTLAATVTGCGSQQGMSPGVTSDPVAEPEASIDDAVLELVGAAESGDTDYFMSVEHGADEAQARRMIATVMKSNILEQYESYLTTSSPTEACIKFAGPGALIISLKKGATGWSVTDLGT